MGDETRQNVVRLSSSILFQVNLAWSSIFLSLNRKGVKTFKGGDWRKWEGEEKVSTPLPLANTSQWDIQSLLPARVTESVKRHTPLTTPSLYRPHNFNFIFLLNLQTHHQLNFKNFKVDIFIYKIKINFKKSKFPKK